MADTYKCKDCGSPCTSMKAEKGTLGTWRCPRCRTKVKVKRSKDSDGVTE